MPSNRTVEEPLDLLLIEDNPGDARLFRALLEDAQLDARTQWERSLGAGLEAADEDGCDVVVLDLGLPDSQGVDTVRRVTETRPDVPVVVLTGLQDRETALEALEAGAADYLEKDELTPRLVGRTLRWAVDRHGLIRKLEAERSRLEDVFRQAPSWIAILKGPDHVFSRVNPAYREFVDDREVIGRPAREVFPELEGEGYFELLDHVYETGERVEAQERFRPLETDEGVEQKYITFVYEPRREDGEITGVIAHGVDVTEQVERRRQAERAERHYRTLFAQSPAGIAVVSEEGRVVECNRTLADMLGYEPAELEGVHFAEFTHPEDVEEDAELYRQLASGEIDEYQLEKRFISRGGEVVWGDLRVAAVQLPEEEARRQVGFVRDITVEKRVREQLRHRALHDPLTGLANRTLLVDRVAQGLARARREGHPLGLLMLDVVRFKRINDQLGHAAGDRVLEALASRLQERVREEDTVARWGGDEFVVVLLELEGPEAIRTVHERIQDALQRPFEATGESVHLDLAVGGVICGEGEHARMVQPEDPEELVRFGDLALHRAKRQGAEGFHLFDPEEEVEGVGKIRREQELRRGLEAEEFVPHYQPVVRLEDGELVGFEALARWAHPERGIVSPGEFILLAEELGLIGTLGEQVLEQGARQAAGWPRTNGAGPPTVSFNLSGHQFEDPRLAETLARAVEEAGLSPERVILEVTETVIMQDPARIDELRALGFRVHVDDFGTGYSTFAYLRDLSLDGLKIDMNFIQRMTESPTDAALVETMLRLGETLDLRVVAEGVETEDQRARLCEMGCDLGQGYLFARPMPAEDVVTVIED